MVSWRRELHAEPEVGLELPDTHARIYEQLSDWGLQVQTQRAGGVAARFAGTEPDGTTMVLRADMDALPAVENTGLGRGHHRWTENLAVWP